MRPSTRANALPLAGCALALSITLTRITPAHACSPLRCAPSSFLPVSGHVPSNAVEFLWRPPWTSSSTAAEYTVRLNALDAGMRTEIESEVLPGPDGFKRVRPLRAVAEGTVLVLESAASECPNLNAVPAMVTVSAAAPKPSKLGTLQITETLGSTVLNIPTSKGSCRADFEVASARLALRLDASAEPYADSLRHALLVDGAERAQHSEPAPISNMYPLAGALEDVIYTLCRGESDGWTADLTPGTHRVQWLTRLPDGSELRSDEISVDLQCARSVRPATDPADAAPVDGDDGTDDEPSESASTAEPQHAESCALRAATNGAGYSSLFELAIALCALRRRRA